MPPFSLMDLKDLLLFLKKEAPTIFSVVQSFKHDKIEHVSHENVAFVTVISGERIGILLSQKEIDCLSWAHHCCGKGDWSKIGDGWIDSGGGTHFNHDTLF